MRGHWHTTHGGMGTADYGPGGPACRFGECAWRMRLPTYVALVHSVCHVSGIRHYAPSTRGASAASAALTDLNKTHPMVPSCNNRVHARFLGKHLEHLISCTIINQHSFRMPSRRRLTDSHIDPLQVIGSNEIEIFTGCMQLAPTSASVNFSTCRSAACWREV